MRALASSLRARGQATVAEFEERALARRGQVGGRSDLGVDQAVSVMASAAPADQLRLYKKVIQQYGRDGGVDFYDRVTKPLLIQMLVAKRRVEFMQVIQQTRAVLTPEPDSQLDRELNEWTEKVK